MADVQLPAGWYEDPRTRARRYWDGERWADLGHVPPPPPAPGPSLPQGQPPQQVVWAASPPTNGLAVAGFVLSLVGILLCGIGSVVGFVMSLVALDQIKRGQGAPGGKGLAIAGAWIGGIITVLIAGWVLLVVVGMGMSGGSTT